MKKVARKPTLKHKYGVKALLIVLSGLLTAIALTLVVPTDAVPVTTPPTLSLLVHKVHASEQYFTCPMHPTIVQDEAGECPICGMALVPKEVPDQGERQGANTSSGATAKSVSDERKIKHWVAPMDPTYISDGPGKSPMGMDLVPVYQDAAKKHSGSAITIDPVVVQNMGVRVADAERGPIFRHVRTIGEIDVAEDELSVVNLRFSGWVERIWADQTGQEVKRGQKLFSIYSPELVSAQEEYLLAVNTAGIDSPLAKSAARRLRLWELPGSHLKSIVKSGNAHKNVVISSPRSGYILHKNIVQGARVKAGSDIYRIGNLKKIWVNAEVYEFDAPWIKLDQRATMELSFQQGRHWEGRVSYIYPTLESKSRTLKVRLEFPNPGVELKPGMFATVRIEAQRKEDVLHIPSEAIIHSGERQLVFIAEGYGRYAPRQIVTGLVGDNYRTEVLTGLAGGETVVTSGQFLLDSESQLQEAVQKLLEARLHAKNRKEGDSAGDEPNEPGDTYWTCSMHPTVVQDGPGTCPMCGMDLVERKK